MHHTMLVIVALFTALAILPGCPPPDARTRSALDASAP